MRSIGGGILRKVAKPQVLTKGVGRALKASPTKMSFARRRGELRSPASLPQRGRQSVKAFNGSSAFPSYKKKKNF